jgi:hypothetical protein
MAVCGGWFFRGYPQSMNFRQFLAIWVSLCYGGRGGLSLFPALRADSSSGHLYTNYKVTGSLEPPYAKKAAYDFPGSYWKIDPATGRLVGSKMDPATGQVTLNVTTGIDNQFEPWYVYLFHMLVGHHGVFSLSPIFVFTVIGLAFLLNQPPTRSDLALLTIFLPWFCSFYIFFAGQRNYGACVTACVGFLAHSTLAHERDRASAQIFRPTVSRLSFNFPRYFRSVNFLRNSQSLDPSLAA